MVSIAEAERIRKERVSGCVSRIRAAEITVRPLPLPGLPRAAADSSHSEALGMISYMIS